MSQRTNYYLNQMGIEPWVLRRPKAHQKTLQDIAIQVSQCEQCVLHQSRTQTVFSRGNIAAKLMIIGEAPGLTEDKQGLPFVGEAGQLLDKMLRSISLNESMVYITNIIKCRPPDNRDPKTEELATCSQYLRQQIGILQPHVILALGRFAGQFLLNKMIPLNQMRQSVHQFENIPVIVTYHPAYLLRNPSDKAKAYDDLLCLQQLFWKMCDSTVPLRMK